MEVSSSALNYLLIESVPLARDVAVQLGLTEDIEAEVSYRTEKCGYEVGEDIAPLVTQNHPYLATQLDIMRFICKELWMQLYKKNMDSLKTNHRDMYVLIDNSLAPCKNMSTNRGPQRTAELAQPFLWYTAGIIRGFLAGLGIQATVGFETSKLPQVAFNVVIVNDPRVD